MKRLFRLASFLCVCAALTVTAWAGSETMSSGKEMKQVAPAPMTECNWTGFYLGLHAGGQFGHAENVDVDNFGPSIPVGPRPWGYDQDGVIAGGTLGYNFQWNWLVLGLEGDLGYMNIQGSAPTPEAAIFNASDLKGHSDSDFYTTIRGRIGLGWNDWLFYTTGGGIGVNWDTRVLDNCDVSPCRSELVDAHEQDFQWGWTVGGGIERRFGCHWSVKAEYLYYTLEDRNFTGEGFFFTTSVGTTHWEAHDQGHIVRAGLNYKF